MVGNGVWRLVAGGVVTWSIVTYSVSAQSVATGGQPEQPARNAKVSVDVDRAPLEEVLNAIARQAGLRVMYNGKVTNSTRHVTLHVHEMSVDDAFASALAGTGLRAFISLGDVAFTDADAEPAADGIITGTVIDSKTKQRLRNVKITLDTATAGVTTSATGEFRLAGIRAGTHRVTARLLGYTKSVQTVTILDAQSVAVTIALEPSATPLDQVVVTGTVIPTELRAIPNAITVVPGEELERRGITHIDQLFRGDIPGLYAQNTGSTGSQPGHVVMRSRGGTSLDGTLNQPIKTYVDGVELADPSYLGLIDPRSIDRIEVVTGPQASTIYGSNAINGVMQIFTKRGTSARPQVTLSLASGLIQNNYSAAFTPNHDYSAQLSGNEGHISYDVGTSWGYVGAWTPAIRTGALGAYSGVRLQQGPWTLDGHLRVVSSVNQGRGSPSQDNENKMASGLYLPGGGLLIPFTSTSATRSFGVTGSYTPTSWWSHTLQLGQDNLESGTQLSGRVYGTPSDTLLSITQSTLTLNTLKYNSTINVPVAPFLNVTTTAGAEGWRNLDMSWSGQPTSLTGALNDPHLQISRQPSHDAGAFLQAQAGIWDAFFVTYGIRAEWNPNYGANATPNIAPKYGVGYTTTLGLLTAKIRGSYGRSTRPPVVDQKKSIFNENDLYHPPHDRQLANLDLEPEDQQGGEGGLELYWGNRLSLTVTRYNQTVDHLVTYVKVDSVDYFDWVKQAYHLPDWYNAIAGYQYQYLNIGSIRNQGWEMQSTVSGGPFTVKGTYSFMKSRLIGITPTYRSQFPQYVPGSILQNAPEHTWALAAQYARARTSVSLNIQGIGMGRLEQDALLSIIGNARLMRDMPRIYTGPWAFLGPGYALADLNVSQRFTTVVEGTLQVQNLANHYQNDVGTINASIGRQTKVGVRIRM